MTQGPGYQATPTAQRGGRRSVDMQLTLAVNFVNLAMGVATGIMTARGLHPHDRGTLQALVLWQATISSFSLTGLDQALILHARGRMEWAYGLRRSLRRFTNQQAAISTPVLLGIGLIIVARNGPHEWLAGVGIASIIWLNNYLLMATAPLRATEQFVLWNVIRLVPQVVYAPSILVLWLTHTLSVDSGVLSLVVANVATAIAARITARKRPVCDIPASEVREARRFGLHVFGSMVPARINLRLDQLMLGLLLPSQYLGIYAVAVSIAQVLQTFGNTLEQVLFPRLVGGSVHRETVIRILILAALGTTVGGLLFAFASRFLVPFFYGQPYSPAIAPLDILLAGAVPLVITNVLNAEAKADARPVHMVVAQWSGVAVTLVALPILTRVDGLSGAAWASLASYLVVAALLMWFRVRQVPKHAMRRVRNPAEATAKVIPTELREDNDNM